MLNCTKCQSQNVITSGKIKGRQRYNCKACNYYYTVVQKSDTSSDAERRLALKLYLEGLGFCSIRRILGFSHVAVYQWIKAFGEQVATIRALKPLGVVELDETHSYIGHKKTLASSGLLLTDLENGLCMLSRMGGEPRFMHDLLLKNKSLSRAGGEPRREESSGRR